MAYLIGAKGTAAPAGTTGAMSTMIASHGAIRDGVAAAMPKAETPRYGAESSFRWGGGKDNGMAVHGANAVGQTTQAQQDWMSDFLYPSMQREVATQDARGDAVWNAATQQNSQLNEQANVMQAAGNRIGNQQEGMANAALAQSNQQQGIANSEMARYGRTGGAALDSMAAEAMSYNGGAEAERQAGLARGDVASAFASQRSEQQRQQQSYGINPNSGAAQAGAVGLDVQEAALRASAGNKARTAADALGWQKRGDVVNMGNQVFSNSQGAAGMASNVRGQAAGLGDASVANRGAGAPLRQAGLGALNTGFNAGQQGVANMQGFGNTLNQGYGVGLSGFGKVADVGTSTYGIRSGAANAAAARKSSDKQSESAGWGQALGTAVGIGAMFLSDRRLKENIVKVGVFPSGLNMYEFNYIGNPTRVVGVMADEAEKIIPAAVVTGADGFKRVNYDLVR